MGSQNPNWDIAAGSATGIQHIRDGLPCQDAFDHSRSGDWLVAVVCDGAGSARHSDIGAQHAAETIVRELVLILDMAPRALDDANEFWHKAVVASVGSARSQLKQIADSDTPDDLSDYHATVVGSVVGPDYGFFFHIGDGAGFALRRDGFETVAVSKPENGEYSDQTFFFTMSNWREHLRLSFFSNAPEIIALMSDGAMAFTASKDLDGLDEKFIAPVMRYLESVDGETGSKALANTLGSEQTHAITGDDKTLLIAMKRG